MDKLQWTNTYFTVCFTNYKGLYQFSVVSEIWENIKLVPSFFEKSALHIYYRLQHSSQLKKGKPQKEGISS